MTCNVGTIDRILRTILGLGLISLVFVGPQTPWGWLGLIPLGTAAIGWCPPYALLGLSTCAVKTPKS
ncbi:MAG: DUF2892 domain-containing protein [Hyphomicrobiaceae bacterium]